MNNMRSWLAVVILVIAAGGFLAFSSPGTGCWTLGFATAHADPGGCSNC